ncbi:MAG: pantoate--beta-alanine ligase [Bacteroidales bacterium]|nr:pantoate--beta-alanine ligase [Bacteroidales bacterium]
MILAESVSVLRELLNKRDGDTGLVPTMGALHEGHLSLVKKSKSSSTTTVVSIFINPTQFNDPGDLKKYPRNIEGDLKLLHNILSDNDIVFTPQADDLYSFENPVIPDLGNLDKVMEGKQRPGHFSGVVRIVKLLFEIVKPDKAFFGQKDFQQLTIIKEMVRQLKMRVEIIGCPILREATGLAMSSRNQLLTNDIRTKASIIYKTLKKHSTATDPGKICETSSSIIKTIDSIEGFRTEYFEIVNHKTLESITDKSEVDPSARYFGCIAVFAGDIRLIDNTEFSFSFAKG